MHVSFRWVVGTILTLSAIEVIASSSAAAGRVGGALQGLGTLTRYLMSPSLPLIPDLRAKQTPKSAAYQTDLAVSSLLPPVQG